MQLTFDHNILDSLLLCLGTTPALPPLVLFPEFRKHEWSYSLDDARKGWVTALQQPSLCISGLVEVDADFQDGVLRDAQISSEWCHG
jgi:hypothetical protein